MGGGEGVRGGVGGEGEGGGGWGGGGGGGWWWWWSGAEWSSGPPGRSGSWRRRRRRSAQGDASADTASESCLSHRAGGERERQRERQREKEREREMKNIYVTIKLYIVIYRPDRPSNNSPLRCGRCWCRIGSRTGSLACRGATWGRRSSWAEPETGSHALARSRCSRLVCSTPIRPDTPQR